MKPPRPPRLPDRRPLAAAAITLWIATSPWAWGYANSHPAVANHVALVLGIGPLALLIANLRPAAYVTLLGGTWLAISPWILGYATNHTAWLNELATGLLLTTLSATAADTPTTRRARARLTRKKPTPPAIANTARPHT